MFNKIKQKLNRLEIEILKREKMLGGFKGVWWFFCG